MSRQRSLGRQTQPPARSLPDNRGQRSRTTVHHCGVPASLRDRIQRSRRDRRRGCTHRRPSRPTRRQSCSHTVAGATNLASVHWWMASSTRCAAFCSSVPHGDFADLRRVGNALSTRARAVKHSKPSTQNAIRRVRVPRRTPMYNVLSRRSDRSQAENLKPVNRATDRDVSLRRVSIGCIYWSSPLFDPTHHCCS
jgi:hypothetical protein